MFISSGPGKEVLFNGTLRQGELRQHDEPQMALVVADAGAVDVYINGKPQPKAAGERKTYNIAKP